MVHRSNHANLEQVCKTKFNRDQLCNKEKKSEVMGSIDWHLLSDQWSSDWMVMWLTKWEFSISVEGKELMGLEKAPKRSFACESALIFQNLWVFFYLIKSLNDEIIAGDNKQLLFPIKIPYQIEKLLRSHTQEKLENKKIFIWWQWMWSKHYKNLFLALWTPSNKSSHGDKLGMGTFKSI